MAVKPLQEHTTSVLGPGAYTELLRVMANKNSYKIHEEFLTETQGSILRAVTAKLPCVVPMALFFHFPYFLFTE